SEVMIKAVANSLPRISCICPTANRGAFLAQSIHYFEEQDYPNKELIIIEDGDEMNGELCQKHTYHFIPGRHSIGGKRNLGGEIATGTIFCHWDDDDYYGP